MADRPEAERPETVRLDKWLWHARFFKTRSLAADLVNAGRVRVDGAPVSKPSRSVRAGHVLTFPQGKQIRVVRILAASVRRGPAPEAQELYEDLTPEAPSAPSGPRYDGKGRPSAKDRRDMAKHLPGNRSEDG
ncbi:RNA-binding S4 domain-containing protein [Roseisalinus antarcticus]|uniref:Heat shock protein 15 n=1 Tax=Roseisalinus antarcticus TaxID=254357 RepID=A0A1Y5RZ01_9RHOB|nr:RNA-binding S4 domain-containing protein [Roseisalinus antarcticus]SLN27412.1 Heat shock protein 15 [Roseisalinus antarcticus]